MSDRQKKKHSDADIVGQLGVNLIESVLLGMGQIWRPTSSADTGIDGEIEIRDPGTCEVSSKLIKVQSKAIGEGKSWESENETKFVLRAKLKDLEYWKACNLPMILVASRPSTKEAYWVAIKGYGVDSDRWKTTRIDFDKQLDRFDDNCLTKLIDLLGYDTFGLTTTKANFQEELTSNLLPVRHTHDRIFVAETDFRHPKELADWFRERKLYPGREWILRNKRILSFHDLREPPWSEISDRGTVEDFESDEWAQSADQDVRREWVQLLNHCLTERLGRRGIRLRKDGTHYFYFWKLSRETNERTYSYKPRAKNTSRLVVKPLLNKKTKEISCYRHSAMSCRFHRFDSRWYLEITPTYFFTLDGEKKFQYHHERLSTIKRFEHNDAVRGQVIMWEHLLTERGDLYHKEYPFLQFAPLEAFTVERGIPDEHWRPYSPPSVAEIEDDPQQEFGF